MVKIDEATASYKVQCHPFLMFRDLNELPQDVSSTYTKLLIDLGKNPLNPFGKNSQIFPIKNLPPGYYIQQMKWQRTGEIYGMSYDFIPEKDHRVKIFSFATYERALDRAIERINYESLRVKSQQIINCRDFYQINGGKMTKESNNGEGIMRDTYNIGQAGAVGKYARSDNNTFFQSEQKQTLAQAAAEIQQLLKQLEETNPTATEGEKIAYVNDETTPSFKRRVVGALQAGSEAAIEEFLDNSYLNVGKAIVKGWIKPE